MTRTKRATAILVLLFAITAGAPGYAVAEPPVPVWKDVSYGAVLYETTENLSMRALERGRRRATSELLGFARVGSPLCPELLVLAVAPTAQYCTLNATGGDNISLKTGKGTFGGDVEVVVQEVIGADPVTKEPITTPDSPEVVIAKGRFTGKMDFSAAIVGVPDGNGGTTKLPRGTVKGHLSLDGFGRRVPFTGVFRLPFITVASVPGCEAIPTPQECFTPPLYLLDDFSAVMVRHGEMAIGYPTVRFEISF